MAMPRKPVTLTGNSPLAPLMAQFVQEKRACGYRYDECASSLRRFDAYLCRQGLQQRARHHRLPDRGISTSNKETLKHDSLHLLGMLRKYKPGK